MQNSTLPLMQDKKMTFFLCLFFVFALFSTNTKINAQGISSGVTFNWADDQNNLSDPATLDFIEIDGSIYNTFVVPSAYEMTRVGPGGHNGNDIQLNGTEILGSSNAPNWNSEATKAYQSLNLNHYFESNSNGDNFCGNFGAASTTNSQIQTIIYSPGIPSNPDGILAVTERGGNNCQYLELYGTPAGGGSEELLGRTFVRTSGDLRGVKPQAPPVGNSDYWSSGRNNENDQIIGIALFKLSDIAPVGSTITSIKYYAATVDNGDGKFFLMQTYAVDDIFESEFGETFNGDVGANDNVPSGSSYSYFTSVLPLNGTVVVNTDGTFTYTPNPGFVGTDIFEVQVCLPAPNQAVCNTSTVTLTVKADNLPTAIDDSYTIGEDVPNNSFNVLSNDDFGLDGPQANTALTINTNPSNGTASVNDNGTPSNPLDDYIVYIPNPYFNGSDSLVYQITDGNGTIAQANVDITVNPDTTKNIDLTTKNITVNENVGLATITVQIQGTYQVGPTISYRTIDNSAFNGQDYISVNNDHTFTGNDGETFSFTIPITDDNLIEPSEVFNIEVTSSSYTTPVNLLTDITILDNDGGAGTGVSFDNTNVTVNEGAGTATFNVTLAGNVAGGFTLDYATDNGSAIAPGDYDANSGQLSFTGNDGESHPITVSIVDDNIIEATENFLVNLSNLSTNLISINTPQANGNIMDNDGGAGTGISFDNTNVTVNEDAGTATFNVTLAGNVAGGFTLDYATDNGSAIAPGDYDANSGQLSFTGNDGESHPITVSIVDDNIIEATENFLVNLSNLSTNLISINTPQANGNIMDNDGGAGTGISFDNTNVTVNEDAGTATFNVTLAGNVAGGFTLDYATDNGSAIAPGDYDANSGQLSFTGNDGESHPITVSIVDDNIIEATENFLVNLSNLSTNLISINTPQANGNIMDNDGGAGTGISFDNTNVTVNEGAGTATFNVTLAGNVAGGFTLDYATDNGSAIAPGDYDANSGQLSFTGNDGESHPITVSIVDDNIIEATENFLVNLSNLSTNLISINTPQANGNIMDNDGGAGTGISFDNTNVTVNEGAGTATFNVTLAGNVAGGFTLDYATDNGSAIAPGDYDANSGQLSFTGNDGESHPITVSIVDDNIIEATENFLVNLSNLSTNLISINTPQANGNIMDNDGGAGTGISFDNTNVTVNEDAGTATFNVTLAGNVAGGFTLDYATDNGSAIAPGDYDANSGQLSFTGNDGESHPITVSIVDDNIIEATENFLVNLSNLSTNLISINTPQANGNIMDNDGGAGTGISFENTEVTVNEGDGTATFNARFVGNFPIPFTVEYNSNDGTATNGQDYTGVSNILTFSGLNGQVLPITVPITDDTVIEPTEDFNVNLFNVSSDLININTAQARGRIIDNDAVFGTGISFSNTNLIVTEGTDTYARFTVTLTGDISENVTVDYVTNNGTAIDGSDMSAQSGTVTFTPTVKSYDIDIPIIDDLVIEPQENFTVVLSNIQSNIGIGFVNGQPTNTANGTINDDDASSSDGISFVSTNVEVTEGVGVTATFEVELIGNFQNAFDVSFETAFGTATATDLDAQAGVISFNGNDGEVQTITVIILNDDIIEPTEAYMVNLTGTTNALVSINTPQANGTILDDDLTANDGISFVSTNVEVTEGVGVTATFEVELIGNFQNAFDVSFETAFGTATATDLDAQAGVISFNGNDGEVQTITVIILNDDIIEPTEAYMVNLTGTTNALVSINTPQANGTILDDDLTANDGISFVNTNVEVTEGVGVTATFEVELTGNFQNAFDVSFETAFGTATATDLNAQTGVISFNGTDGEVQNITVNILNDNIIEPTEGYVVNLTGTTDALVSINTPQANGTILDDDMDSSYGVQFDVTSINVDEAAGTVSLDVILNADVQDEFTVEYNTTDGTATDAFDYTGVNTSNQSLTFGGTNPNNQVITVPIVDDIIIEETENFIVLLSNISTTLVTILSNDTATVNIIDNDGNEGWPEDVTIEACDNIPPAADITTDSACMINVVLEENIEGQDDGCATEYTITRTWTITDCVNNVRVHVQVITIEDTSAPTFVEALPQDMTVACNEVPEAVILTALDSCEPNVEVVFEEVTTNGANCALGYTVTRTWSASDCAGNMVNHSQVITVPSTGPIVASPYEKEITILCGDEVPEVPELTFSGGCGIYEVVFTEEVQKASDSDDFMIIRTWDVTDACGNTASFEQIIFVLQPQLEEVTIDICIEEEAIDLLNYLPEGFDPNGEFMILEGEVTLNGSIFDPLDHQPGEYKIAYSSVGGECKYYVDFTMLVNTDCVPCGRDQIEISKAITPNGDGVNDKFEIKGVEFCQFTFDIMLFNRWGNKVAEVKDYQNNWGGESPSGSFGSSGMLPAGTYYYIINATDTETGKVLEPLNGYIYLGSN